MLFASTFSAAAILALASQLAGATTLSTKFLTSTSQSGSGGPDSSESYYPNSMVCGMGTTCDGACGSGFSDCAGGDGYQGCYNQTAGATCCSNGSSCDAGWYCYTGNTTHAVCCPDGADEGECAAKLLSSSSSNTTAATTASGGGSASASATSSSSSASTSTGASHDGNATTSSSSRGLSAPGTGAGSMLAMLGIVAAGAAFL